MARNRKQRRQQHGSAWHGKQTDYWYYTEPGAKKRVPLFDEKGERILRRHFQLRHGRRVVLAQRNDLVFQQIRERRVAKHFLDRGDRVVNSSV